MPQSNIPHNLHTSIACVEDVIEGVSEANRPTVNEFALYVALFSRRHAKSMKLNENCFYKMVTTLCNDLTSLRNDVLKEGSVLSAMWVIFLRIYWDTFPSEISGEYKYKSIEDFQKKYRGCFPKASSKEVEHLWKIANWMNILFRMIPARGNKCFYLHVVPKLVEGFDVKYILGTGQSCHTTYRAEVFEHESGVPRRKRKYNTQKNIPTATEKAAVEGLFSGDTALSPSRRSSVSSSVEETEQKVDASSLSCESIEQWSLGLKTPIVLNDQPLLMRFSSDGSVGLVTNPWANDTPFSWGDEFIAVDLDANLELSTPLEISTEYNLSSETKF